MKVTICFLGPDGSGKTTHASMTAHWFINKGMSCRYYHFDQISVGLNQKTIPRKLKFLLQFIDGLIETMIVRLNNKILVVDRYPYDLLFSFNDLWPTFLRRLFIILLPDPDLIFLLHAKSDVVTSRKNELSNSEYSLMLSSYVNFLSQLSTSSLVNNIDTSEPIEKVFSNILTIIKGYLVRTNTFENI